MGEQATCKCDAPILIGEPPHPRLGIGRVAQAYCFACDTLLYWQDGKPMTQAMVPAEEACSNTFPCPALSASAGLAATEKLVGDWTGEASRLKDEAIVPCGSGALINNLKWLPGEVYEKCAKELSAALSAVGEPGPSAEETLLRGALRVAIDAVLMAYGMEQTDANAEPQMERAITQARHRLEDDARATLAGRVPQEPSADAPLETFRAGLAMAWMAQQLAGFNRRNAEWGERDDPQWWLDEAQRSVDELEGEERETRALLERQPETEEAPDA